MMRVLKRLRRASVIATLPLFALAATAHAERAWCCWSTRMMSGVDSNEADHRRDVAWKKVAATNAKSDCDDRVAGAWPRGAARSQIAIMN